MIDNFNQITDLLSFESEDEFYFVQILQRKKDNPGGVKGCNNSSRLIKAYYISSREKLMDLKEEMIFFANHFNARVGINLNKRSYEKTAFNLLKKVAEQMHNKNYKATRAAYNTVCGVHNSGDKVWLLDVDTKDEVSVNKVIIAVSHSQPLGDKVLAKIPSKAGFHLITKGFDTRDFSIWCGDVEIHKNNPTNLYIP